jgi:hypothetical protein
MQEAKIATVSSEESMSPRASVGKRWLARSRRFIADNERHPALIASWLRWTGTVELVCAIALKLSAVFRNDFATQQYSRVSAISSVEEFPIYWSLAQTSFSLTCFNFCTNWFRSIDSSPCVVCGADKINKTYDVSVRLTSTAIPQLQERLKVMSLSRTTSWNTGSHLSAPAPTMSKPLSSVRSQESLKLHCCCYPRLEVDVARRIGGDAHLVPN